MAITRRGFLRTLAIAVAAPVALAKAAAAPAKHITAAAWRSTPFYIGSGAGLERFEFRAACRALADSIDREILALYQEKYGDE